MSVYRFVGTYCEIWDTEFKFTRFGQKVEMPDALAKEAKTQGAALVPEDQFSTIGFSEDELKAYRDHSAHRNAPESFLNKRSAAWKLVHEAPVEKPVAVAPKKTAQTEGKQ
jgi:hypothetical protein